MTSPEDVQKLAALARIGVPEERLPSLAEEFSKIVEYIDQLANLSVTEGAPLLPYENVLRKDGEPHEKGVWTDALVAQFPERDGNYLSVKKIISHD